MSNSNPKKRTKRVEGRWRLDFSAKMRKRDTKPENDEQRRNRIKQWLEHNYPHVVLKDDDVPTGEL